VVDLRVMVALCEMLIGTLRFYPNGIDVSKKGAKKKVYLVDEMNGNGSFQHLLARSDAGHD